jgi:hypothetical protein
MSCDLWMLSLVYFSTTIVKPTRIHGCLEIPG